MIGYFELPEVASFHCVFGCRWEARRNQEDILVSLDEGPGEEREDCSDLRVEVTVECAPSEVVLLGAARAPGRESLRCQSGDTPFLIMFYLEPFMVPVLHSVTQGGKGVVYSLI